MKTVKQVTYSVVALSVLCFLGAGSTEDLDEFNSEMEDLDRNMDDDGYCWACEGSGYIMMNGRKRCSICEGDGRLDY